MKQKIVWKTALQSIRKNKKRSILTMIGIVIGIAAVITIVAIGNGFKQDMVQKMTGENQKENEKNITLDYYDMSSIPNNNHYFSKNDLDLINSVEGVKKAYFPKMKNGKTTRSLEIQLKNKQVPVTVEMKNRTEVQLIAGRELDEGDNDQQNKVVIVDEEVAKDLYDIPKEAVGKSIVINNQVFSIVGVSENVSGPIKWENQETFVYMPIQTYSRYFGALDDATIVNVEMTSEVSPEAVLTKVLSILNETGGQKALGKYVEYRAKDEAASFGAILDNLTLFISAVAGISLFIAGVGVMNMMYISVTERTREIGIRRALGATSEDIKKQFLMEGIAITLGGGLVGYLLGMLLALLISIFLPFAVHPDILTIIIAVSVSIIIGVVFSYFPASAAAKKDLIDILR